MAGKMHGSKLIKHLRAACSTPGVETRLYFLAPDQHATVFFGHHGDEVWLDWIHSQKPGQGAVYLEKLTREAERLNVVVRLQCDDDGTGKLASYYERFGFYRDPAGGLVMERVPSTAALRRAMDRQRADPFEGSKVVDGSGERLAVFHGGMALSNGFDSRATFFTTDEQVAHGYARRAGPGGSVAKAYLALKNPKVLDFLAPNTKGWYERRRRSLMAQGFDGMVIGSDVFVAFEASQILEPTLIRAELDQARDATVKSSDGQPLVLFHGSKQEFDTFDFTLAKDGAHWFVADAHHAASFGVAKAFYLTISNPMEISQDTLDEAWNAAHPEGEQDDRCLLPRDFVEQFVVQAKAAGHDGLIIRDMGDRDIEADMYLPFTAAQIRSADGELDSQADVGRSRDRLRSYG
jgi:hypothetical protein